MPASPIATTYFPLPALSLSVDPDNPPRVFSRSVSCPTPSTSVHAAHGQLLPTMERAHLDKVLSSYVNIGKTMFDKASNASMDDAHGFLRYFLVDMSVVPVLLTFHSFFAALAVYRLTAGKQFWLKVRRPALASRPRPPRPD